MTKQDFYDIVVFYQMVVSINVAEKELAGISGENFKKIPVIFPVLREFDPGLFSPGFTAWAKTDSDALI
jgi:hypothetical protein